MSSYLSGKVVTFLKEKDRQRYLKCHQMRRSFNHDLLSNLQSDFHDHSNVTHYQGHYQHNAWF